MTTSAWKQRAYPAGTRITGFDLDGNRIHGELLTAYDLDSNKNQIPRIRLDNGKTISGYECWWIPVDEVSVSMRTDGTNPEIFTCTSEVLK